MIHLHVHARHSFLDGLCSSERLAERSAELGFKAIALTDHGSCAGWLDHQKACDKYGIKPIFGVEAYFVDDAKEKKKGEPVYHITLLAKSEIGIQSIFKLMTDANDCFYYRARFDLSMLCECQGVIVMSACGYRGLLNHPNYKRLCSMLTERFQDDFYLEIMPINMPKQDEINERACELHIEAGIPLVVTCDAHYATADQAPIHSFLLNINTGGKIKDTVSGLYLQTEEEIYKSFTKIDPAFIDVGLASTIRIAEKCNARLEKREIQLPVIVKDSAVYIRQRAFEVLERKKLGEEYKERLEYELQVIEGKKFTDYFVLVKKIADWARKHDFEMPVGRGSSGGSLLCWVLGITGLDPLKYGLLFERFLNSERSDWPDIDLDFEDDRREEILDYLKEEFGEDRVANISTYAELKPKSAFRDVCRASGIAPIIAESITKLLPDDMTLTEAIEKDGGLREKVKTLPNWKKIVKYSEAIVGCLRQGGKHAAGIVCSPMSLHELCVLEKRGGTRVVNWDLNDAEWMGLVKIDLLGLRTLSIMAEAKRLIFERHGTKINWEEVDLEDPKLFDEFNAGRTIGIFQFESQLQRELLKKLAPVDLSVLIDCNALGRPGPLDSGMTGKYVARKGGELIQDAEYVHWIAEIVEKTFGAVLYQEQIIQILRSVAGYSTPQADILRRVIAKSKGKEEFQKHESELVEGCSSHSGMPRDIAQQLFRDLEAFSRYSFPQAHACAYTLIAMRQAWLKFFYPVEYMTALFRKTEPSQENKILEFVQECLRLKIAISMPDINHSGKGFSIKTCNEIVAGLEQIKNVGPKVLESIIKARENGPFESVQDFHVRVPKANKRVVASLLQAGAFDSVGANVRLELGKLEGREETGLDYTDEEKTRERVKLLPQLWQPTPEVGMRIDRERLEKLDEIIKNCRRCELWEHYKSPVPSEWGETSKIMVIGEAPGADEVRDGKPFVGKAGKLLMKALKSIGIKRSDLYIGNVYKCRPLGNKLPSEVSPTCHCIMLKEIELTKPRLIICAGNTPRGLTLKISCGIKKACGTFDRLTRADGGISTVFSILHPASCFHDGDNKVRFQEAIEKLGRFLKGL